MTTLDETVDDLVAAHGIDEVLLALCRAANSKGMVRLCAKLNAVYDWLVGKE